MIDRQRMQLRPGSRWVYSVEEYFRSIYIHSHDWGRAGGGAGGVVGGPEGGVIMIIMET